MKTELFKHAHAEVQESNASQLEHLATCPKSTVGTAPKPKHRAPDA